MTDDTFSTYTSSLFKTIINPYDLSAIGDFKQAMVNMAIGLSIPKLFQKYGIGLNGLQLTQGVAAEKSNMNLINEGLGSFNWIMSIIPSAINILFVFLIALYLPMAITAVIMGTEKGLKIIANYFFGLLAFKSIDIGLAVVHNIANYYDIDHVGQLYYGVGGNLFNVMNMPNYISQLAQASGLAGVLGIAAVFLTPSVIFYGETKAAASLIGAIKGFYTGTNPDLAASEINKLQGNLEYQEQLHQNRSMAYIASQLGIDTAEGAKLYNQMQSEIEAINRGAAFGAIAVDNTSMNNYAMGSYGKAISADFQTAGAGSLVNSTSIQAIERGSFAMGAKGMAQTIGYGSEVHLEDAAVSGLRMGEKAASTDNYVGSHMTKADAVALGTQEGASLVNQAESLIKSGAYDKEGHMTEIGKNYNLGIQKTKAKDIRKTAKIGEEVSFNEANRVGDLEGITASQDLKTIANKMTDEEARALGSGSAIGKIKNANNWLKSSLINTDGTINENATVADMLSPYKKDLEKQKEQTAKDYDKKIKEAFASGDVRVGNKLIDEKQKAMEEFDNKIAQVDKEIKENGNKKLLDAYLDGSAKGFAKSVMKEIGYGISGEFNNSVNAGLVEGIKAGGADKGEYLAVLKDKGGIGDLFTGAEREARAATNKTIGVGELIFTDKDKHRISEKKAMGFIKAGAAKGFEAQILAGEADLDIAFGGQGPNGEKIMRREIAHGLYRSEEANLANIASMSHLRDKNGNLIKDDEFYKNIRAQGIEKGEMAQAHAEEMRDKYGDTLSKNYKGKTFAERAAAVAKKDVESFAGMADIDADTSGSVFYENAIYGEDSKIKTSQAKIHKAGGARAAANYDAAAAGFNFDKLIGDVKGKENLKPEDIKKFFEEALKKAKELDKQTGGKYHYAENLMKDLKAAGIMDSNGNIKGDIDSYIQGTSYLHTRAISAMTSIAAGGMNITGTLGGDKPSLKVDAMSSVKGGDNSVIDNSHTQKTWGNLDIARSILSKLGLSPKDVDKFAPQLASNEELIHALKTRDYGKALAMLGLQKTFGTEDLTGAITTLVGSATATSALADKIRHAINGDRIATEDMEVTDKYGRKMKIKKGDTFNLKDIDPEDRIQALEKSKIEPSFAGKVVKKAKNGLAKVSESLTDKMFDNTSTNSLNNTPNSTNKSENSQTSQSSKDNPHNSTPSDNVTSSINDGEKNVKSLARDKFKDIIEDKEKALKKDFFNGKISQEEFNNKLTALENIKHKLENGKDINYRDLKNADISVKDLEKEGLVFKTNAKGNIKGIDFEATDNILSSAQSKSKLLEAVKKESFKEAAVDYLKEKRDELIKSGKYSPDSDVIKGADKLIEDVESGKAKINDFIKNAKTLSDAKVIHQLGLDNPDTIKDIKQNAENKFMKYADKINKGEIPDKFKEIANPQTQQPEIDTNKQPISSENNQHSVNVPEKAPKAQADELRNMIENKNFRSERKRELAQKILQSMEKGEKVSLKDIADLLNTSQKALKEQFPDLVDGKEIDFSKFAEVSNTTKGRIAEVASKITKNSSNFITGLGTLGKFVVGNLIEGTPLNPTFTADDDIYTGKFKGFAPDDDWLTPKEAILKVGNNALETNVNYDALQQWLQKHPKKAQQLQSALNHNTFASPADLEAISSPEGLFNYIMGHTNISPTTAIHAQSPLTQHDLVQSVTAQVQSAINMQNMSQAMQNIKDVLNPVAPAFGTTIPTMGGELGISQTENGYLKLGNYETRVPMSEFRNYMNQHPEAVQQFTQALVNSGFNNNNVYDRFGKGYEKIDNGQVEHLLANLAYFQQTATKDSQVGLSTMTDYQERMIEILEEKLSVFDEKKDIKNIK